MKKRNTYETLSKAIETSDGHKGLLVDAYGVYSGNIPEDVILKMKIVH